MSQVRCVLQVKELDCPTEMGALQGALLGSPGVLGLGFDLIHGTMTVDYDDATTGPPDLIQRVGPDRPGCERHPLENLTRSNPGGRGTSGGSMIKGSGLALFLGVVMGWAGASPLNLSAGCLPSRSVSGGWELFLKALRSVRRGRFDIHLLMGLAVLGALALGQWDEAATVAFRGSGCPGALEVDESRTGPARLGRCRRSRVKDTAEFTSRAMGPFAPSPPAKSARATGSRSARGRRFR